MHILSCITAFKNYGDFSVLLACFIGFRVKCLAEFLSTLSVKTGKTTAEKKKITAKLSTKIMLRLRFSINHY